jgi:hypothetical protein
MKAGFVGFVGVKVMVDDKVENVFMSGVPSTSPCYGRERTLRRKRLQVTKSLSRIHSSFSILGRPLYREKRNHSALRNLRWRRRWCVSESQERQKHRIEVQYKSRPVYVSESEENNG